MHMRAFRRVKNVKLHELNRFELKKGEQAEKICAIGTQFILFFLPIFRYIFCSSFFDFIFYQTAQSIASRLFVR